MIDAEGEEVLVQVLELRRLQGAAEPVQPEGHVVDVRQVIAGNVVQQQAGHLQQDQGRMLGPQGLAQIVIALGHGLDRTCQGEGGQAALPVDHGGDHIGIGNGGPQIEHIQRVLRLRAVAAPHAAVAPAQGHERLCRQGGESEQQDQQHHKGDSGPAAASFQRHGSLLKLEVHEIPGVIAGAVAAENQDQGQQHKVEGKAQRQGPLVQPVLHRLTALDPVRRQHQGEAEAHHQHLHRACTAGEPALPALGQGGTAEDLRPEPQAVPQTAQLRQDAEKDQEQIGPQDAEELPGALVVAEAQPGGPALEDRFHPDREDQKGSVETAPDHIAPARAVPEARRQPGDDQGEGGGQGAACGLAQFRSGPLAQALRPAGDRNGVVDVSLEPVA